jgi:tRNA1(Val) A37 N6-methylase TrmN6
MYLVDIQITANTQTQNLEHSHCAQNVTVYNQNIKGLINKTEKLLIVISMKQIPS